VVPADDEELRVPADVAEMLGSEARLEVGPGEVVILRPGKLSASALAADVEVLDDPSRLRHTTSALTPEERAALADFLAE
jgi:hypothetical protein